VEREIYLCDRFKNLGHKPIFPLPVMYVS